MARLVPHLPSTQSFSARALSLRLLQGQLIQLHTRTGFSSFRSAACALLFCLFASLHLFAVESSTVREESATELASQSLASTTSSEPAALTSPAAGSQLTGSSATFAWTTGTNVTAYRLYLGTKGSGTKNVFNSGAITAASVTVTDLPMTGATIYAELSSEINGSWKSSHYTFTAAVSTPTLSVSVSNLAFGNVAVNSASTQSVTLSSIGNAAVTVSSATVSGAGFSVSGATLPLTLNPGQTASLTVQFDPTAAGAASGTLTLASNSSSGASSVIGLSGTGVPVLSALSCPARILR